MLDLSFKVEKAAPVAYAAAPLLNFALQITDASDKSIHAIALRCQIRIEPGKRRYEPPERERLTDLFGDTSRWGQTLRPMLWEHASVVVPPFHGNTTVNLPVHCTFDFNIAATKFFHALENGEVPLVMLFSGTVFYVSEDESLKVAQIPWDKETTFRLPVRVWREMMEMYYPNSAWLCLRKDAFEQLDEFKRRHGIPTWEAAIEKLLAAEDAQVAK
jgi:hypothetical protein